MQLIVIAFCLARASAGSVIPAMNGMLNNSMKPDTQIPAIASPWPDRRLPLRLILTRETMPRTKPISAVMPHMPRMPNTSEAIAIPLVLVSAAATGNGGGAPGAAANAASNSGTEASVCQSAPPSGLTLVCAWARPSVIHWRNTSLLTGPYSLPSAPRMRYMLLFYAFARLTPS